MSIESRPFQFLSDAENYARNYPEDETCIEQQDSGAWVVSVLTKRDTEQNSCVLFGVNY